MTRLARCVLMRRAIQVRVDDTWGRAGGARAGKRSEAKRGRENSGEERRGEGRGERT